MQNLSDTEVNNRKSCVAHADHTKLWPVPCRRLCQCSLELVKPKHRLQRLFHSLQVGIGPPGSNSKGNAHHLTSLTLGELAELNLLVSLLPDRLQEPLLAREDLSTVGSH